MQWKQNENWITWTKSIYLRVTTDYFDPELVFFFTKNPVKCIIK